MAETNHKPVRLALIGAGLFTKDAYVPLLRRACSQNLVQQLPSTRVIFKLVAWNCADGMQVQCRSAQSGADPRRQRIFCYRLSKSKPLAMPFVASLPRDLVPDRQISAGS